MPFPLLGNEITPPATCQLPARRPIIIIIILLNARPY
jgi:hypothetical protein